MKKDLSRRKFVASSATVAMGLPFLPTNITNHLKEEQMKKSTPNLIGAYGPWAASLNGEKPGRLSFRNDKYADLASWKPMARKRVEECLAQPDVQAPKPVVEKIYNYDGLHIEELSWQLPYGAPTKAYLLKPENTTGKLPAILAFHDHGANKYFGRRKITKTSDEQHPLMKEHQDIYYEGKAWANEIAKRGYVVLVADAFTFASRRVLLADVPEYFRNGLSDANPEDSSNIEAYNDWAAEHEHTMAKSLFSAGTSWPAVFMGEDQVALDILAARPDVDEDHIGCAGLSGGGLRTVFTGGLDERIKCAVCVGFMSTWKDFILYKSFTHTWMTYVPLLANDFDFPEILGMRVPLPTMVLHDTDDDLYTLPEMQRSDEILSELFQKASAADKYKCNFYPGPHKFDLAMQTDAFSWFDKWLKN